jgi:hypothetical protein
MPTKLALILALGFPNRERPCRRASAEPDLVAHFEPHVYVCGNKLKINHRVTHFNFSFFRTTRCKRLTRF